MENVRRMKQCYTIFMSKNNVMNAIIERKIKIIGYLLKHGQFIIMEGKNSKGTVGRSRNFFFKEYSNK